MDKVFKVIAFIWFFGEGLYSISTVMYAMKAEQLGEWLILLLFYWSIALTLYFTGDFIRRVSLVDERMNRIIKSSKEAKESK